MKELCKVKNFYFLLSLAAFLIILLPVGIANIVFGYMMGDSPCYLCWGQREAMIFIGVVAFFIVRYGFKGKYIAALLLISAVGLYQSFLHYGAHAHRDLDQGFSLQVFGIHTYFWAEVVFWFVIIFLGILFLLVPKFSDFDKEMNGKKYRDFSKTGFIFVIISSIIVASNAFQAFVSTGVPPYIGQGDPVRFSLNPKYVIWSTNGWKGNWQNISFLGDRDVKAPDYAFAPASEKLGIKFDNDSNNSPFASIDQKLNIISEKKLEFDKAINTLAYINNEFVASSKWSVYFLNDDFSVKSDFELDPYFSATIDPIIGIIPYLQDKFMLMGSNKSYLRFAKNENADEVLQYADFIKGADKFEGQGDKLGRGRLDTVRAKLNHTASMTSDDKYFYLATVPNNKNAKKFVISKFLLSDRVLSAEFTPKANLKEGSTLGELYITSMTYKDGLIYALSKNHNVIAVIDPNKEEVVKTISYPDSIKNARSIFFKDNVLHIMSYQDSQNILYTLK
ncbi:MAG TPA: disulfide bond formation protein B [Campylobacter avium]|uniref:disulfide bond formation protein DsbI n=1 Tax=Campylobacter avium TaxID=522485 RepID=UPI001DE72BC5|nr:disulfide bond formation protein B [Campylobacter avium]HJE66171.1 disulfide bond formation protein B [Campylobacter avium]